MRSAGRVLLSGLVGILLASCSSPSDSDRMQLEGALERTPGVPFVLPVEKPPGLAGVITGIYRVNPNDGSVYQRSVTLITGPKQNRWPIEVCAGAVGTPRLCEGITTGRVIKRPLEALGMEVHIGLPADPAVTHEAERFWETAPLTADLAEVEWLT